MWTVAKSEFLSISMKIGVLGKVKRLQQCFHDDMPHALHCLFDQDEFLATEAEREFSLEQ